jgi:hypothetical protein
MHYHLFTCPACESHFRVVWPEPCPRVDPVSKLSIRCPACNEHSEPYAFLLDKILRALSPAFRLFRSMLFRPVTPTLGLMLG